MRMFSIAAVGGLLHKRIAESHRDWLTIEIDSVNQIADNDQCDRISQIKSDQSDNGY